MTPAKMFEGNLWVLASDATQMAENAYKNGQAKEREACAKVCDELANDENTDEYINAADWCAVRIRARGQA